MEPKGSLLRSQEPAMVPILSQMHQVHTFPFYFHANDRYTKSLNEMCAYFNKGKYTSNDSKKHISW